MYYHSLIHLFLLYLCPQLLPKAFSISHFFQLLIHLFYFWIMSVSTVHSFLRMPKTNPWPCFVFSFWGTTCQSKVWNSRMMLCAEKRMSFGIANAWSQRVNQWHCFSRASHNSSWFTSLLIAHPLKNVPPINEESTVCISQLVSWATLFNKTFTTWWVCRY